jgi:hypothetical protein
VMPTIYTTEGRHSKQPLTKALAQHPLVLLDQQLKVRAKEDNPTAPKKVGAGPLSLGRAGS